MRVSRPSYSAEFKSDAVELLRTTERSLPQVAKDLGVSYWSLRETFTFVAIVNLLCCAISVPRSQVRVWRNSIGRVRTCLESAVATVVASLPSTFTSLVNRVWRSTRVAMWLLFDPLMRSPSQCPGTARSSTSAGRSRIEIASTIRPRDCSAVVDVRARRIKRLERRCRSSSRSSTPRA